MKRKRLILLLVIVVGAFLLIPAATYVFFRLVRHEHFYLGFPSSFWARQVRLNDLARSEEWLSLPYTDEVRGYLGFEEGDVLPPDKTTIPVLMDLLGHADPKVTQYAAQQLAALLWRYNEQSRSVACISNAVKMNIEGQTFFVIDLVDTGHFVPGHIGHATILVSEKGEFLDGVDSICYTKSSEDIASTAIDGSGSVVVRIVRSGQRRPAIARIAHGGQHFVSPPGAWDFWRSERERKEWMDKGIYQLKVRDGKFVVVWPVLAGERDK
jgi:hypothetical protein